MSFHLLVGSRFSTTAIFQGCITMLCLHIMIGKPSMLTTDAFTPYATSPVYQRMLTPHSQNIPPLFVSTDTDQHEIGSETENKVESNFKPLPRHSSNEDINKILERVEGAIKNQMETGKSTNKKEADSDRMYANSYVDLGKVRVSQCIYLFGIITKFKLALIFYVIELPFLTLFP